MKRILAIVLLLAVLFCNASAYADESRTDVAYTADDIRRFQPYTDVDLESFLNAGFTCTYYDDFEFYAIMKPPVNKIHGSFKWGDERTLKTEYSIELSVYLNYNAGICDVLPVLVFTRDGNKPYVDSKMTKIYIKNNENRYIIDASYCTRDKSNDKYHPVAKDVLVAPLSITGLIMLKDFAYDSTEITVKMGEHDELTDIFTITNEKAFDAFRVFYSTCEDAGVLKQDCILTTFNLYSIKTFHNNKTSEVKEDIIDNGVFSAPEDITSEE